MKSPKILLVVIFLSLGVASMGWCLSITEGPYNGIDPGNIDSLLGTIVQSDFNTNYGGSNPVNETAWANDMLGTSDTATFQVKDDPVSYYSTSESGVFAFKMDTPPESEYFIVKNATYWALFANLAELAFGVFDTDHLPGGMNLPSNDYEISHVTRFNSPNGMAPVPEPATMVLLGLGLIGLAGLRRKFNR